MFRSSALIGACCAASTLFAQCVTSFPSNESFTNFTAGSPGTLENNWINTGADDLDWWVDKNGTPTANTGPIGDHTSNSTSGTYMYVETSGGGNTPNKTALLTSPCYQLSGVTSPYVTFWYHMRGAQSGSLHVDLNLNGAVVSNVWSTSGDQGLYWKQGWINLSSYGNLINTRLIFRAVTGSGETSDIAIDDVFVGSLVPVVGCSETTANNYNASVNINNNSCDYSCPAGQSRIRIDIVKDNYPQETSWTLKDGATNLTLASGTSNGTTLCVPSDACLVFRINDTAGDGIYHNSYGYGGYWLYSDQTLVLAGGVFGSFEETTFNCPPGFSCTSPLPLTLAPVGTTFPVTLATVTTPSIEAWYDFTPPQPGSYTISTCVSNSCDTRLWLYDMACNQIVLSDGIEGATFGDDNEGGCGLQAVVNANMPAGVVHHLRVGDNDGDCGGQVTFSIIYNGPVIGCMDPGSCNYDPLATVDCGTCCIAPGSPECTDGPDLIMSTSALASSIYLSTVNITDQCAPVEGCTKGLGTRNVLRFTTRIENIGTTDYYIGNPTTHPSSFSFDNCHGHAHYAGYADYVLFDASGNTIPVGFKNGFCVIDVGCNPGFTGQYGCSNMGISKGCYDIYGSGTTCNWIDITDVPAGQYTLVLRTNWLRTPDALGRHELDYSNNFAQVCIDLTRNAQNEPSFTLINDCPAYTDCLGQPYGDARFDCTGACNGTAKMGDLNADGNQTQPDAQEYVQAILGNDISPTACNDLNGDNVITVMDAALMANCYNQQDIHDQTGHVLHYHPWCDFPRGWTDTGVNVDLQLGAVDPIARTVDIMIRNPNNRVMGYEFEMSGLTIQSVQNLVPSLIGDIAMETSLGGTKVIGLSYIDSSMAKNTEYVPLCRITYLNLNDLNICIANITDIVNEQGNNVLTTITGSCAVTPNTVTINPKIWLAGPYNVATQLMNDNLRSASLIPLTEPYTALGFTHVNGGGGEQTSSGVLAVTGNNAIVDWVMVEVRSTTVPYAVIATVSALLQRDGDVVNKNGTSAVQLQVPDGNYQVSIRHRNHLGVMTLNSVALSATPVVVDFRSSSTLTWGTNARMTKDNRSMLWSGNSIKDGVLKYTGSNNDRDPILGIIGGIVPTNSIAGYYLEDTDMSGVVKYTGAPNDRDLILENIGGVVPTNTVLQQLP
ncbi:MAG: hypothetical protein KA408_02985 [Flavobacteriales bacterium]|nr:hypothetical protein [Flavobacteriales bacterium]